MSTVAQAPSVQRWRALGTTAVLRTSAGRLAAAVAAAQGQIAQIDAAANRFDPASDLSRVNAAGGRRTEVSPLTVQAVRLAVGAAAVSRGAVDPTIGQELVSLGYDRDWDLLAHVDARTPLGNPQAPRGGLTRSPAWRSIELWDDPPAVRIPPTIRLDLGATAKALAADLGARAAADLTGNAVLLSLGGDIATGGPASDGGWPIRVADDHRDGDAGLTQDIAIVSGGLATSSLVPRRWYHDGRAIHHIVDPRTGLPVTPRWRTASVAAADCAQANVAATAALVLGDDAPGWLTEQRLPARLVGADRDVRVLNGWPA
jgi:thiamine biosynthesis lipoprotein